MSYTNSAIVRSIVDSDMTDAEITNIITWSDDWVNKHIDAGAATAAFLEHISSVYASWRIMLKDPNARKLGEYAEDRGVMIKMLKDDLDDLLSSAGGGVAFTAAVETLA